MGASIGVAAILLIVLGVLAGVVVVLLAVGGIGIFAIKHVMFEVESDIEIKGETELAKMGSSTREVSFRPPTAMVLSAEQVASMRLGANQLPSFSDLSTKTSSFVAAESSRPSERAEVGLLSAAPKAMVLSAAQIGAMGLATGGITAAANTFVEERASVVNPLRQAPLLEEATAVEPDAPAEVTEEIAATEPAAPAQLEEDATVSAPEDPATPATEAVLEEATAVAPDAPAEVTKEIAATEPAATAQLEEDTTVPAPEDPATPAKEAVADADAPEAEEQAPAFTPLVISFGERSNVVDVTSGSVGNGAHIDYADDDGI